MDIWYEVLPIAHKASIFTPKVTPEGSILRALASKLEPKGSILRVLGYKVSPRRWLRPLGVTSTFILKAPMSQMDRQRHPMWIIWELYLK